MPTSVGLREKRDFTIGFQDAAGAAAAIDGVPVTVSDAPAIADVIMAADGLSGTLVPAAEGTCTLTCTGDADLGAGIVTVTFSEVITVTAAGQATTGGFVFGPATPQ